MRWLFLIQLTLLSLQRGKICLTTVILPKELWANSIISASLISYTHKETGYKNNHEYL